MGFAYLKKFEAKVGVHQESVLSPLFFAIFVNVITEKARRGVVNKLLCADDLVFMSKTIEDLKERFWNWKDPQESKIFKVNTRKTKVMASGSEEELFISKINLYEVCGRRVMANSLLCTKCRNWINRRCAKIKRVAASLAMCFVCSRCRGLMEGTVNLIEKLCDEVETGDGFCHLGDTLNSSGGCEEKVIARVGIGLIKFKGYGKLLLSSKFPSKTKGKVYCFA